MPDALDYSFSRPTSAQALAGQGIRLVQRYLSSPADNPKNVTAAEAQGLLAAGVALILGWEQNADRAREGWNAGTSDGGAAGDLADAVGYPRGLSIYFAVDFDTTPGDYPAITAYFQGVAAGLAGRFRVGVYGEADALDYLHGQGLVSCAWQTYAWSQGRLTAVADLYQYLNGQTLAGAEVDFDRIIHAELLGAWWPPGLAPLGSGSLEVDDMSAQDSANIAQILQFQKDAYTNTTQTLEGIVNQGSQNKAALLAQIADLSGALVPIAAAIGKLSTTTASPSDAAQLADIQAKLAALAAKTYTGVLS